MKMIDVKKAETFDVNCENAVGVNVQRPSKILHFCDGTMEVFEDDEEEVQAISVRHQTMTVAENEMAWTPWLFYKANRIGSTVLNGCDYVGESLATFLGITTPKYESEIAEFKRMQAENERLAREKAEHSTWMEKENLNANVIVDDVKSGTC